MCGIIGILGNGPVAWPLIDALKRLEYRGYDSAGIAVLDNGAIRRRRAEGKIDRLRDLVAAKPVEGASGIGHTRWATHGAANEANAHPHATGRVAVVHNGIVENFLDLRGELEAEGCAFVTETDTEAVAQLITRNLERGMDPVSATDAALERLEGAFALAILFAGEQDLMIGARRGSPLAFGPGEGEMFLGSDALALAPFTDRIAFLEEGDRAVFSRAGAEVRDAGGRAVERPVRRNRLAGAMIGKGNYRHYMQKEIHEQPTVIGETLRALFNPLTRSVALPDLGIDLATVAPRDGNRLRHGALCGHGRQILAGEPGPAAGGPRYRFRAALPRAAAGAGGHGAPDLAVGRDDRHAGGAALCAPAGPACGLRGQCGGECDRA